MPQSRTGESFSLTTYPSPLQKYSYLLVSHVHVKNLDNIKDMAMPNLLCKAFDLCILRRYECFYFWQCECVCAVFFTNSFEIQTTDIIKRCIKAIDFAKYMPTDLLLDMVFNFLF